MPRPMTRDELIRRKVSEQHVISKSLTPASRRLAMGLPLYSCSCGEWDSNDADGDHAEAIVLYLMREVDPTDD